MELNKFFNMDCENGLDTMILENQKVNGIITSPPYNIIRPNSTDRGYDEYKDGMTNEEYSKWIVRLFKKMDKVLEKNGKIIWNMSYGCENTECMSLTIADILRQTDFTLADIIVWKKNCATPNNVSHNKLTRICEFVYVFCRRSEFDTFTANKKQCSKRKSGQKIYENVFNFITAKNNDESCPLNKATFSTEFVDKLINIYFKKGETVLDIFGGTGTTAISCFQNGLDFISFELSTEQCKWAEQRLETISSQFSLFR